MTRLAGLAADGRCRRLWPAGLEVAGRRLMRLWGIGMRFTLRLEEGAGT